MYKAVIIDDEQNAQKAIINIIENFCSDVEIIGTAFDVKSGIKLIISENPDIVFLDIEMPDGTGFDLLQQLPNYDFSLIFATGHNDFAVKAFKFNAVDYILKPVDIQEVINAVKRALSIKEKSNKDIIIRQLLKSVKEKEHKKLILKTSKDIYIVNTEDIIRCESDGGYTTFFLKDGNNILVSKNLKEYEKLLKDYKFIRTHNSHLVNLNFVEKYGKTHGSILYLKDGSQIPVSVRKKEAVLFALENF